jgi:membrane fusion protein (multidrug efflux system)
MNVCKVSRFVNYYSNNNVKSRYGAAMSLDSPSLPRLRAPILIAAAAAVALSSACGPSKPPGGGMQMPPAQVVVGNVQPASIPIMFEYVGQTAGSKEVEVRARVPGILERKLFNEGAWVKSGQPLFIIDPKPLEAQTAAVQADLARAQAQKAWNDREAARLRPLAERHAIGQKEADDAVSQAELAAASVRSAQAKLDETRLSLGYTRVVAPVSGLTSRSVKSEGSLVAANETLLTTISQIDPIWVLFNVSENEQLRLTRGVASGALMLPANSAYDVTVVLADGTAFPRKGRINFADPRINPATGTYEMRAELPNADGALRPGQFVRVRLAGAMRQNAIAVPQAAVLEGPQGKFVYVTGKDKDGKDVASPRPITVGDWVESNGNRWIVESGLKAGDPVIVDGIARIMMPNQPIVIVPPGAAGGAPPGAPGGAPPAAAPPAKKG